MGSMVRHREIGSLTDRTKLADLRMEGGQQGTRGQLVHGVRGGNHCIGMLVNFLQCQVGWSTQISCGGFTRIG
jgi:hypothetical protein